MRSEVQVMTCSLLPMCVSVITNIGGRAAPVCDLRHIFALLGLHSAMGKGLHPMR